MAQQVQVLLIDDLDGNKGRRRAVRVGLDGTGYEIGLIAGHVRRCLTRWRATWLPPSGQAAQAVGPAGRRASVSGLNPTEVRRWARTQGIEVKNRGRVPAE